MMTGETKLLLGGGVGREGNGGIHTQYHQNAP